MCLMRFNLIFFSILWVGELYSPRAELGFRMFAWGISHFGTFSSFCALFWNSPLFFLSFFPVPFLLN